MNPKLFWLLTAILLVLFDRALAQQPTKISRIGFVSVQGAIGAPYESFRRGLIDHGYIDGQNIALEYRSVDPNRDRAVEATSILTELLRLRVELIVTGDPAVAHAAKTMTATVPILVVGGGDLLANKLVASLAHPGEM